jgi:hypothetical protein
MAKVHAPDLHRDRTAPPKPTRAHWQIHGSDMSMHWNLLFGLSSIGFTITTSENLARDRPNRRLP